MSDVIIIVMATLIVLGLLSCAVITFLKGRLGMGFGGIFIRILWIFGACRLAKPRSYWARTYYDEERMTRSVQRYPEQQPTWPPVAPPPR